MQKGSVAVIGCGWLGLPLSLKLLSEGYDVYGTTTREENLAGLEKAGIKASVLKLPVVDFALAVSDPFPDDEVATPASSSVAAARNDDEIATPASSSVAAARHDDEVTTPASSSIAAARHDNEVATPASSFVAAARNDELWKADQLVLNIPPNRKDSVEPALSEAERAKTYPAAVLSALLAYRRNNPSGRIIFTSSIGVYGREHGLAIDRDTRISIEKPSVKQASLLLAESQVQTQSQRPYRILRLGGLYGGSRDPKKWFTGREIPRPDEPTNLVSRERVVAEIVGLLNEPFWVGEPLYNVTDAEHRSSGEVYG